MSDERYHPNYDFEPGELMPWQEMSKLLRELVEMCSELTSIFGAEHSDIKTRLDDLEQTLGEHITKDLSEEFGVELSPQVYPSIDEALDAHRTIDQWLI